MHIVIELYLEFCGGIGHQRTRKISSLPEDAFEDGYLPVVKNRVEIDVNLMQSVITWEDPSGCKVVRERAGHHRQQRLASSAIFVNFVVCRLSLMGGKNVRNYRMA